MRQRARTTHHWIQRNSGWAVIVLALVMASVLSWTSYQNRKVSTCQASYNQDVSQVFSERAQYADEDRKSLVEFVTQVQRGKSPEERTGALNEYLNTMQEIDERRKANPVPTLSPGRCGDE